MLNVRMSKDGKWGSAVLAPGETKPRWSYSLSHNNKEDAVYQAARWAEADFGGFPEDFKQSRLPFERYSRLHFNQEPIAVKNWCSIIFYSVEPQTNELGEVAP